MTARIDGHAYGHSRIYQQAEGTQLHVERAYFGSRGELLPWLADVSSWPLVRECDPLHLGVHRARVARGNAVPGYIERDVDSEISSHLSNATRQGGLVLIIGDSTAGKSRAAYEAMQRCIPDYRIFAPDNGSDLRSGLVSLFAATELCVLWLDDFERYLGVDGLAPSILAQLRMRKLIVVATIRTERYRRLVKSFSLDEEGNSEHRSLIAATEHVLNQATPVFLSRRWTQAEIVRAAESDDERVVDALEHTNIYGIAEYLAAGPKLYDEWRHAWEPGANPRGAALVAAAVDCTRVGLTDPVPIRLLEEMHETYLDEAGGVLLRPEALPAATEWAQRRRYGVTSLLLPGKSPDSYRVFDYLPDAYIRSTTVRPVPDSSWSLVIDSSREDQKKLFSIAIAAENEQRTPIAESLWRTLAESGNGAAAENLGRMLWTAGRQEESIQWLEVAAGANNLEATFRLGWIYEGRKDAANAERWFTQASEAGHTHSMLHLAQLLERAGRLQEAEPWIRGAARENEDQAAATLGRILAHSGRLDEAKLILARAGEEGDGDALVSLGVILDELGQSDAAEEAWLRAADLGSEFGSGNLAMLYSRQNRLEEAETWYRRALEQGLPDAARRLGLFLLRQNRKAEGERYLLQAADKDDSWAYLQLGIFYFNSGRNEEAERWLRKATEADVEESFVVLAATLERAGRDDEAETYYREASKRGDRTASLDLGSRLRIAGRLEEAEGFLRLAAESNSTVAACELGRVLYGMGRVQEAEEALLLAVRNGHTHASCTLAELLLYEGRLSEAEEAWKVAFADGDHPHAAERLVDYYMTVDAPSEAALWLRRARGVNRKKAGKAHSRTKKKNRRRGK
ncbi:tetratricopeptide repeat protein [Micromonospora chalcea]|uniref:tetratricopeptide repeat protein n=1 Tax=Micromonospora chalcea TaxID=1874 RepID=UPI00340DD44F